MKVGDLVMIVSASSIGSFCVVTSNYKGYQGQLALIVRVACLDGSRRHNDTRVQMVSDGAVLWFLTKELQVIK
tara:strand:- start:353 stop:571 length:219 start_codon:yes stop_codon:yes gene_type:complete